MVKKKTSLRGESCITFAVIEKAQKGKSVKLFKTQTERHAIIVLLLAVVWCRLYVITYDNIILLQVYYFVACHLNSRNLFSRITFHAIIIIFVSFETDSKIMITNIIGTKNSYLFSPSVNIVIIRKRYRVKFLLIKRTPNIKSNIRQVYIVQRAKIIIIL